MAYQQTQIDGDLTLGRNLTMGGELDVKGKTTIANSLTVKGWLDAPNIVGVCKGLFTTSAELWQAYPYPQNGWWALVGATLPAQVWRAKEQRWEDTHTDGGLEHIVSTDIRQRVEDLEKDVAAEKITRKEADAQLLELIKSSIGGGGGGGATETHTHLNKASIDRLTVDDGGYIYVDTSTATAGSAKVGYADNSKRADKADVAHDLTPDSPANERFLNADAADTAQEVITLKKGAQYGASFVSGLTGTGGYIDGSGAAELDSLTLRKFLEVPELRYNRVTVMAGVQWRGPGGGIIEVVVANADGANGIAQLKLEDGERPMIAPGDLCMGIFHNPAGGNATTTTDSGTGRMTMSGFSTVYFEVVALLQGFRDKFQYKLRADSHWTQRAHPVAGMHFAVFGNRTNVDRQQSRYSTLTYERFLKGVNDWEWGEAHCMAQFGDLTNLTIGGVRMAGYSAYINNLYMSGRIKQFELKPATIEVTSSTGEYIADAETCTLSAVCRDGYGTDVTSKCAQWTIRRDSGDKASDDAWNAAHTMAVGKITLRGTDVGADNARGTFFFVTCAYGGQSANGALTLRRAAKDGAQGLPGKDGADGLPGKDGKDGLPGKDGINGLPGKDGLPGRDGADGRTTYFHIKYSANPNGVPMGETPNTYIGTYVDFTELDSTDPKTYKWHRFEGLQGKNGENGLPGVNGKDGRTYYLHIKYSNDGGRTFTANNGETVGDYIGVLTDEVEADSNVPSAYKWSKTKGEQGQPGKDGAPGKDGVDGQPGKDGVDGLPGKDGVDGQPGEDGAQGFGEVFGWSVDDAYTEAEMNEWFAVDGTSVRYFSRDVPIKQYPNTRIGDFVSGSFRAKDTQNVHTMRAKIANFQLGGDGRPYGIGIIVLAHSIIPRGAQGVAGAIYRKTEWKEGVDYNGGTSVEADGRRYVDIVVRKVAKPDGTGHELMHFVCKQSHRSSAINQPGVGLNYWTQLNAMAPTYTPLLLADNASIDFLQGNTIRVTEGNKVVATMGNGEYPLYVGAEIPEGAPFKVRKDGHVESTAGKIGGWSINGQSITSPNGSSMLDAETGNIACSGMIIRRPTKITDANIGYYFTTESGGKKQLNLFKAGTLLIFKTERYTPGCVNGQYEIRLPASTGSRIDEAWYEASQFLGVVLYIFNLAQSSTLLPEDANKLFMLGRFREGSKLTNAFKVLPRNGVRLECKNLGLDIYWEVTAQQGLNIDYSGVDVNPPVIPGTPYPPLASRPIV